MKLPELFLERIEKILPEPEMKSFQNSFEEDFRHSLRVNTLKISAEEFWKLFPQASGEKIPWLEDGFFIERKGAFTKTPFYHAGLFYVQEASSMIPVEILNPKPGERILDACASPGSKTTQLIARMENKGLVIANEFKRDRVGRLMENLTRWGAKNTVITNQPTSSFSPMFEFFDKILLDAPCSGEGMFKKDPDALRLWSLQNVQSCAATQKHILRDLVPALKVGGTMIYSTCTMAPEENEENISWLLENYPGCFEIEEIPLGSPGILEFENKRYPSQVEKTRRMWPHRESAEGFYIAKIKKIAPTPAVDRKISPNRNFLKEPDFSILKNLFSHLKVKISPSDCFQIGYKIYHKGNLNLKDFLDYLPVLKPVYMGVWLGNEKTKRIEPAHAFALSFRKEEMDKIPSVELKEPLIIDYLRGHEIPYNSDFKDGFRVVTHEGFPVGWANYKQKRLKNFFPKGMRNKL